MRSIQDMSAYELDGVLAECEIISFDIFGTLLVRAVTEPGVVFDIVEAEMKAASFMEGTAFRSVRSAAERPVRNEAAESTLQDIYERLGYSEAEQDARMALEKAIETRLLFPYPMVEEVYKKALDLGKTIVVVSDMYLSSDFLGNLLHQKGFDGFDKVFVSCEHGKDKKSGGLFDEVISHYGCSPNTILHIGDSVKADVLGAKGRGIRSLYVGESWVKKVQKRIGASKNTLPIVDLRHPQESPWFDRGYRLLGPLLVAFSQWLHDSEENDDRILFFLARDAKLLLDAYALLYPAETSRLRYLYLSRKSVYLPCLSNIDSLSVVQKETGFQRYLSWSSFMDDLGIDEGTWKEMVPDESRLPNGYVPRDRFFCDSRIVEAYEKVLPRIKEKQVAQRELLRRYLDDAGFDENAVIVDIGWRGSTQRMLERLYSCSLQGFYMGTHETTDCDAKGFLFDDERRGNESVIAAFCGLFETLFFADHGTTLFYEEGGDGEVSVKLGGHEYAEAERRVLGELQRGAMRFVEMAAASHLTDHHVLSEEEAFGPLRRLALAPSKEDIELFGSIGFLDHGKTEPLVPEGLGPKALLHPGKFYKGFFQSNWKVAYLKKTLMVPLPYGKVYQLLRHFAKR